MTGRILLLIALVSPAQAFSPVQEGRQLPDSDLLLIGLPYSMQLELGIAAFPTSAQQPSVFTSTYWSREFDQRSELQNRFGIRLGDGTGFHPYALQQTAVPGHPQFNFVQELHFPGGALTGLQFEHRNLLFEGDRLTVRTTSDVQTLLRGVGFSGSETELDLLSLLGWRSHSRLVWQLGEPTRELQWQVSAGYDRRSYVQSTSVDFTVLRRF